MTNVLTAFSCQRTFVIFYLLNSDITRGVVHNYAFSCIHRHIGCRQRKCAWNLDGTFAVLCIVAGTAAFAGGIVALAVALLHRLADEIDKRRGRR